MQTYLQPTHSVGKTVYTEQEKNTIEKTFFRVSQIIKRNNNKADATT